MIITDIEQIDNMAEQMFGHNPNLIAIDMNVYIQLKAHSSYLNATSIEMPRCIKTGIEQFEQAVKEFKTEGVNQILLQFCGVSSSLEVEYIRFKEMCSVLRVIESHFQKKNIAEKMNREMILCMNEELYKNVDVVWGLSNGKAADTEGYEVNVIVGYH